MSRNMAFVISDKYGKELAVQKVPYGSQMHVDDGDEVKRGARLAQWDPYMRPILTEVDGVADSADLVEGVSMKEQTDEMHRAHDVSFSYRENRSAISHMRLLRRCLGVGG